MKKRLFTAITVITAAVLLAAAVLSVNRALAYFTDYQTAEGSVTVGLKWETKLHENAADDHKDITIENIGDTTAIVRVQIFAGDFAVTSNASTQGGTWVQSGGWWYYTKPLAPGETSGTLHVEWNQADAPDYDFNVIVVHESERIVYENNTTLKTPEGWAQIAYVIGG